MRFLGGLDLEKLARKTCLLRTNLDIKNLQENSVRIEKSLPTIQFLLKHGARPIIMGHRGRPHGPDPTLSVKPVINLLSKKIGQPLEWLENLRFDSREQKNDLAFAKELAARGDIYVNDDFATSHHSAASLVAITKLLPSYAGLLLEEEIKQLSRIRNNAEKPLVVIIGGIKIEDKLGVISSLQAKADYFLLGSAYTNLLKWDFNRLVVPEDTVGLPEAPMDLGPKTIARYSEIIRKAKTVIWSGPLGNIEHSAYRVGSRKVAEAIIESKAFSVVGGGDTLEFLTREGMINQFSFVSTGGGAMLEFLAGQALPGLTALDI